MSPADALDHDPPNRPLQPRAPTQRPATMPATAVVLSPAKAPPALPLALPPAPPVVAPTPPRLLRAVRRRLLPAVCCGLALGWLAAVGTWLVPGLSGAGAYSLVHVAAPGGEKGGQAEAALVKQRAVLEAALADPEAAAACPGRDPAEKRRWLERALTADFAPGPGVLRIGLPGERPEKAARVLAAVTHAYLDASAARERQDRAARLEAMTAAAARYEEQLRGKREALLQRTHGADDGSGAALRQRLAAERLAQAEHDLFQVQAQLTALQAEGNNRRPEADETAPAPAVDERLEALLQKDVPYQNELQRQAALQRELDQIVQVAAHPEVQGRQVRRDLEASRAAAEERRRQLREVVVQAEQDRARQARAAAAARREEQRAVLREQEKQLAARVQQLGEEARPRRPGDDEVGRLQADVLRAEDLARRAGEQVQTLRVEQDAPPRATALEGPMLVPPDRRRQAGLAGLAGLGGFALALLGVGWWQIRGGRVDVPEEVTQWLGLRLLGAVPAVPPGVWRRLGEPGGGRDGYWHGRVNEALDVTRTLLLRDPQAEGLQVLLVTSAVGGEGKTSVASQLAASLARAGHKTLLVDADLRRPAAHRLFDLPAEPGLAELLRGEATVSDAVQPTRVSRLWLVPAGTVDGHTPQALAQEGVGQIFEELRGQFDYVVLDACPVLPVADALLLARHADGVVLAVLRDVTRLGRLHAACQRLGMVGARVLGAVVSGARGGAHVAAYDDRIGAAR